MPTPSQSLMEPSKLKGLSTDPKLEHPRAGAAAKSQRRVRVTWAVLRAEARILGYERILSDIANHDGEDVAREVGEELGWNTEWWLDSRRSREVEATQVSVQYTTAIEWDPDNDDPEVRALVQGLRGPYTMQQLAQARADSHARRIAETGPPRVAGPGVYPPEPTQPPRQRSAVSQNPDAAYNAERSQPPLVARDRTQA